MWVPSDDEAVEIFARHFEALHRSGAAAKAKQQAEILIRGGDYSGHRIWMKVAERIRQSIADHQFRFDASPVRLTISIGVASMAGDMSVTPASLLRSADENLYQAKRSGRNRVVS